jgi:type IV pilus assembly protein PilB
MSSANDFFDFCLSYFGKQLLQSGYVNLSELELAWCESQISERPLIEVLQNLTQKPLPPALLYQYQQLYPEAKKLVTKQQDLMVTETSLDITEILEPLASPQPVSANQGEVIPRNLEWLIEDKSTRQLIKSLVSQPSGLLLITGPANSGKSTTSYSLLADLNQTGVNICTLEEPMAGSLEGITQVDASGLEGIDWETILRCFLGQDIDIILVDRIEGIKTAQTILEIALKGHLVLANLPSPDATSAIAELTKMGVEPSLLSNTLLGAINQRLLRRVCPACRLTYDPAEAQLAKFGITPGIKKKKVSFYQAKSLTPEQIELDRVTGRLCPNCHGIGYHGEIAVYEVLRVTKQIKTAIAQANDAEKIKKLAVQEGMKTLFDYALDMVFQGQTTLAEVERIFVNELASPALETTDKIAAPNLQQRLQTLTQLLTTLTQEFQSLKQEINLSQQLPSLDSTKDRDKVLEELPDLSYLPELPNMEEQVAILKSPVYEELTDPGDWEELKKELEPEPEPEPEPEQKGFILDIPDPW